MATCSNCGNTTTKCGCKDTPLTTPPSYTCPPSDSCPDPTPCYETIQDTCVIHSLNYGLPCLGVTAGMTLEQILQVLNNTLNTIGDGTLSTSDEGVLVEASTTAMNFIGPLVNAVSAGANSLNVNINGNLVADLDDVNQNGFSSIADLLAGTTFDFLALPPSFASYVLWTLDLLTNKTNANLYTLVYDPVTAIWRPFNIAFVINELVCTLYSSDGFLSSSRSIGFNGNDIIFTRDGVSDCNGNSSSATGGKFIVKSSSTGLESGNEQIFYTAGHQRINHLRVYNDGYQKYTDWVTVANPTITIEERRLLVGFFSDAYAENSQQSAGYQRTPSNTEIAIFSNPISTNDVTEAYTADVRILKFHDEYDVIDQATRQIIGGGNLIISRSSPTAQHAGIDDIGLGNIILMHGGTIGTSKNAQFTYTGQWLWSEYGQGIFTGTTAYFLATTNTGAIIELSGTDLQQELLTEQELISATSVFVNNTYNGKILGISNGLPITLNIVLNSTLAIPTGTRIEVYQAGAGVITITPAPGVTVNSRGGLLSSNGQYAKFELIKLQTDVWLASGDLA